MSSILAGLSLSRCPDATAYWAAVGPRDWDDRRGAIIVLDADRLRNHYRPEPVDDACNSRSKCEEWIGASIYPLSDYALGYFWLDDLVPGAGLMEQRRPRGDPYKPVHPGVRADLRSRILACLDRGPAAATREISAVMKQLEHEHCPPLVPEMNLIAGRLLRQRRQAA